MKDLGEAAYILGIKINKDRSQRLLGLNQSGYIDKVLKRFSMKDSKRGFLPMSHGIKLSKSQCPTTRMRENAWIKSLMLRLLVLSHMLCFAPDLMSHVP